MESKAKSFYSQFVDVIPKITPRNREIPIYSEDIEVKGYLFYHRELIGIYAGHHLIGKNRRAIPLELEKKVFRGQSGLRGVFVLVSDGHGNYKVKIYVAEKGSKRKWLFYEGDWVNEKELWDSPSPVG